MSATNLEMHLLLENAAYKQRIEILELQLDKAQSANAFLEEQIALTEVAAENNIYNLRNRNIELEAELNSLEKELRYVDKELNYL